VSVQSPRIASLASPASSRSSKTCEIGPANGRAIAAAAEATQNSDAKPVETTRSGRSPAR
jgi:hypothetical protein